jgi:hypothetical protein
VADASDNSIQENEFDGLGQRIVRVDATADPDVTHDYYYNDRWQLLTEVKNGSAYAIYHWHPFVSVRRRTPTYLVAARLDGGIFGAARR